MKKFLSLLLALLMLASMLVACGGGETPETPDDETPGETPETPDTPEEPEQPEDPETPEEPEQPEEPETPTEPEQPEDPETPEEPEQPEQPETPVEPEQPEEPETPAEPEQPTDEKLQLFTGDVIAAGMGLVEINTDPAYYYEGEGSLKSTQSPDRLTYRFEPIDISPYANGFLRMLIYIPDIEKVNIGNVELSSSGIFDKNEINWRTHEYIKNSGWNELWLPLYACYRTDTPIDMTAVNYMRIYIHPKEGVENPDPIYIDDCYFINERNPIKFEESEVVTDETYVLLDGESMPAGLSGVQLSAAEVKSGSTSLHSRSKEVRIAYNFEPLDVSAFEGKYLHMSVYVSDITAFAGGQIELCSGGNCDIGERSWNVGNYVKENGWNEVWLPLTDADTNSTGGHIDMTAVNYLRMYTGANGPRVESDMYFDDIYFAMTKPE